MDGEVNNITSSGGDNPVDNIVDLGLVNYVKHPTNPDYIVYRFADEGRAKTFEEKLNEKNIWFEKSSEEKHQKTYTLFGIHKRDFKYTERINILVEAKHKKPLIPFKGFRWFLILFSAIAMTLAIMGYCESRKKLLEVNETISSLNCITKKANNPNIFSLFAL